MQKFRRLHSIFYFAKILGFNFSVSEGCAAVTRGNDLRGLGICRQQAFTQVFQLRKICVNEPPVQEGITCRYALNYTFCEQ